MVLFIARKTNIALKSDLRVTVCVCETMGQREGIKMRDVVPTQLNAIANQTKDWSKGFLAYKPVWAIGTT
jgi:triosephosphate isomerase